MFRSLFLGLLILSSVTIARAETNLRLAPVSLLAGMLDVEADFAVSSAWTLGPSFRYLNREIDGFDARAYGIGIRGNYYFNGSVFTQGWYLGPSLHYVNASVEKDYPTYGELEGSASGLGMTVLAGYQWMWESFNINLGGGFSYFTVGDIKVKSSDGTINERFSGYDSLQLALEFTLGWKF